MGHNGCKPELVATAPATSVAVSRRLCDTVTEVKRLVLKALANHIRAIINNKIWLAHYNLSCNGLVTNKYQHWLQPVLQLPNFG